MVSKQACKQCRRRKVKCDGLPTCGNCSKAKTACQYSIPKKRGPKSVKWHDAHPEEACSSTPAAGDSSEEVESPALPAPTSNYTHLAASDRLILSDVMTNALVTAQERPIQTATKTHVNLLAGLSAAIPSKPAASIVDHCILLYTQYVFGIIPICHEATVRATVGRFFIPLLDPGSSTDDDHARASRCFAADTERERIQALRDFTLLTALCAAVSYVVPESLLADKHLVAPLFLRAAREMLSTYQDYDLEHPDSSSLNIRLFLSSAIQTASGTHRVAFHILGEAGLIAMRMGLYDEESLKGRNPIEETLLRNNFWHLYICDKTAFVMKVRPVTIHETLFKTGLTLKEKSPNYVPLLDPKSESNSVETENRLLEGFHVIRRLWTMAARVIQGMESHAKKNMDTLIEMTAYRESVAQLSEVYFEMVTLTNDLPALVRVSQESSPDISRDADHYSFSILQRQRTSYLIALHSIKVLVLHSAIQCNMTEVIGQSADTLALATRQIELAQDFLNALENVPFLHIQAEGEHCVEKIRWVGSLLLELADNAKNNMVKSQAHQCAMRLINMLVRLDSKAWDVLG